MKKILIADDEEISRRILKELLQDEYQITECVNGREVIERLKAEPEAYSCLLLDIRMPEIDGFGVLAYMQAAGLIDKIPVITLTSLSKAEDQIKCYRAGVRDLLEKPYNLRLLLYEIRYAIGETARGRKRPDANPAT